MCRFKRVFFWVVRRLLTLHCNVETLTPLGIWDGELTIAPFGVSTLSDLGNSNAQWRRILSWSPQITVKNESICWLTLNLNIFLSIIIVFHIILFKPSDQCVESVEKREREEERHSIFWTCINIPHQYLKFSKLPISLLVCFHIRISVVNQG